MAGMRDDLTAFSRRDWLKLTLSTAACAAVIPQHITLAAGVPDEPMAIGHRPQLFVDDWLVDNRFAFKSHGQQVVRRYHAPRRHGEGPVLVDPDSAPSNLAFKYDREAGPFRLWYQANIPLGVGEQAFKGHKMGFRHVRYAESRDGIHWTLPELGLFEFNGNKRNNICFMRPGTFEGDRGAGISSLHFLNEEDMPEEDRRGYKYLMSYTLRGGGSSPEEQPQVYLIGSHDGIHWDRDGQASIVTGSVSDGWLGFTYDSVRQKYVGYCRPRDRYESGQKQSPSNADFLPSGDPRRDEMLYHGVVRRIGRIEMDDPWSQQELWARTVFLPDEADLAQQSTSHMAMNARCYAGVYFGFLIPYVAKESLWTELVVSRDGASFERTHRPLVAAGEPGSWDSQQAWAISDWVEVGNEWWFTYMGGDAPPNTPLQHDTTWGVGLAKIRKEGFVSLAAPDGGGVVITRLLEWPGGDLQVNCDASQAELRVRVSDRDREVYSGFNYADCRPCTGDHVAHPVRWPGRSLDELRGRPVRLEFYLSGPADLYGFRATE